MTESFNKRGVMESFNEIQIKEGGKRRVENDRLLKLIYGAKFHHFLARTCVRSNSYIYISKTQSYLNRHKSNSKGSQTVTCYSESEFIYMDENYDFTS